MLEGYNMEMEMGNFWEKKKEKQIRNIIIFALVLEKCTSTPDGVNCIMIRYSFLSFI